ncbi:lipopolysaccharide assembly protein LapA domain-containing protein [Sphingomonas immobilis]|nr:lipopolysaccharide assembly protein LapA domain-containing protein [Sphingomonas sp. CA1-15]
MVRVSLVAMQFLKILFWCLLTCVGALFTFANWTTVRIALWGNLVAEVNLPLLLLITFLIGLLPMLLFHQAARWRLRGKLANAERTIATLREALTPPPPPVLEPDGPVVAAPTPAPLLPGATL